MQVCSSDASFHTVRPPQGAMVVQSVLTCAATGLLMQSAGHSLPILHCCIVCRGASLHSHTVTESPQALPGVTAAAEHHSLQEGCLQGSMGSWVALNSHLGIGPQHAASHGASPEGRRAMALRRGGGLCPR